MAREELIRDSEFMVWSLCVAVLLGEEEFGGRD